MSTRVYGTSDDLIEFEGDYRGEICFGSDDEDEFGGALLVCSDGTAATVQYNQDHRGIWRIHVLRKGDLFDRFERCEAEDGEDVDVYSDQLFLKDGIKWVWFGKEARKVD